VNEAFNGGIDPHNPYNWFIHEYSDRIRLKKLGFTSNFDDLDPLKASIFVRIDCTFERLAEQRRKLKEAQAKAKKNR
jgi:hypothetical protein